MLAWLRELITDAENQKSWLWRHCRRRAIYWITPITRKLVTLNPKLKSTGAGRYQLLSRWWGFTAAVNRLSEKVRTLWHCSRLRSVALYLWLIVVISVVAIDRCSNIWASPPGAGYGQFEHMADSLIAKSSKKRRTVREIDVWAESPRLSPLWLSASSSACHGLLIITVITPLPTKPSATKCQRTEAGERGNYWHADASAWCCCARCKNTRRSTLMLKPKMMLAWWCCRWSSSATHQSSLSVSAWSHHRLRRDNAASPDWQTPLNGIISPSERGWSLCKNNWAEPSILMSSADRVAHIDGQLMQLLE